MMMVEKLSQKPTGTNYKDAVLNRGEKVVPVYDDSPNGPFLTNTKRGGRASMPNFLMTKTHCSTYEVSKI